MESPAESNQAKFFKKISGFKNCPLRPGKKAIEINHFKNLTGFDLPQELISLYLAHDGQTTQDKGIFKSLHGYDVYLRPYFLSFDYVLKLWKYLNDYEDLDVFKPQYIPFACDRLEFNGCDNIYCLDSVTGEVFLLAIAALDWTLPPQWQQHREKRAENLEAFFAYQLNLY